MTGSKAHLHLRSRKLLLKALAEFAAISVILVIAGGFARAADVTLALQTDPPHARVFIDGSLRGETPLRIENGLSPGRHRIRIEKNGYRPIERSYPIYSLVEVHFKLVKAPIAAAKEKSFASPRIAPAQPPEDFTGGAARVAETPAARLAEPEGHPEESLWRLGISIAYQGATYVGTPASSFLSLGAWAERQLIGRLGLRLMAATNEQLGVSLVPTAPTDAFITSSGMELSAALPFHVLNGSKLSVSLYPEFGWHQYKYEYSTSDLQGNLTFDQVLWVRQSWVGGGLGFEGWFSARPAAGWGLRMGYRSYGSISNGPSGAVPAGALYGAGSVFVGF